MKRAAILAVLLAPAVSAFATDGYFSHGYGTPYKAMAGAGVALSLHTLAPATNPAAAVFLDRQLDVSLAVFNPNREFAVFGAPSGFPGTFGLAPGTTESQQRFFPIPSLGVNWKLGGDAAFGIAAYGNGGMDTHYHARVFGFDPTGVDLSQMFLAPTYARRFGGRHAIGVSPILAFQRFEALGLAAFSPFSHDAANLTDHDHDDSFGAGVRVGYLGQLGDRFSIGASYQSPIWMTRLKTYGGLFAEDGRFDIPQNFSVGIAVKPAQKLTVAADVQRIFYSQVKSVGNAMLPNLMLQPLGMDQGAGFGWQDMTVWKLGVQYAAVKDVTLRGGYSFGHQPIPSSEVLFNILAPGVMEHHATAGLSWKFRGNRALNLALMRAFSASVEGPNPLEAPGRQSIQLKMNQWELELGLSFGF